MTTVIYLHGFNSAFDPNSRKVQLLEQIGSVVGITYDTTASYDQIFKYLRKEIRELNLDLHETLIVGTSLGGFWAAEIGQNLNVPSVIINPCYDPTNMLSKYVGSNTNHITGEVKIFTLENLLSYNYYETYDCVYGGYLSLVLLDMGDDVIDSYETKELFHNFPMQCWEGGSHRFDHMDDAIQHIKEYLNVCHAVSHMDEENG